MAPFRQLQPHHTRCIRDKGVPRAAHTFSIRMQLLPSNHHETRPHGHQPENSLEIGTSRRPHANGYAAAWAVGRARLPRPHTRHLRCRNWPHWAPPQKPCGYTTGITALVQAALACRLICSNSGRKGLGDESRTTRAGCPQMRVCHGRTASKEQGGACRRVACHAKVAQPLMPSFGGINGCRPAPRLCLYCAQSLQQANEVLVKLKRYELTPQMQDYDAMKDPGKRRYVPYLMYFHRTDFSSQAVNTDGSGFRISTGPDGTKASTAYHVPPGPVRILMRRLDRSRSGRLQRLEHAGIASVEPVRTFDAMAQFRQLLLQPDAGGPAPHALPALARGHRRGRHLLGDQRRHGGSFPRVAAGRSRRLLLLWRVLREDGGTARAKPQGLQVLRSPLRIGRHHRDTR